MSNKNKCKISSFTLLIPLIDGSAYSVCELVCDLKTVNHKKYNIVLKAGLVVFRRLLCKRKVKQNL